MKAEKQGKTSDAPIPTELSCAHRANSELTRVNRPIANNVLWNWAGMAVNVLAGFVVAPALVRGLGETGYGFWILIGSFTGAFGLLDFGIRGSVGRNAAYLRGKGDYAGVNALLSTAIAAIGTVAVFTVSCIWLLQGVFFGLFEVATHEQPEVRATLLIVAINVGLALLANVFDAVLWACQRFDTLNKIDIPVALARVGLSFLIIRLGYGLVQLALMILLLTSVAGMLKAGMSFRHEPKLAVRPTFVTMQAARSLYAYGAWMFLVSVAATLLPQIGPFVIGSQLAVAMVTPFSVANRLVGCASQIVAAGTGVLTPVMTGLHGADDRAAFQRVFVSASMYCCTLTVFLSGLLAILGQHFIALWMGDQIAVVTAPVLTILILGEAMQTSQAITYGAVLGMGRHQFWALMGVAQLALSIAFATTLAKTSGFWGVAAALALSGAVCRGPIHSVYSCRLLGLPFRTYFTDCVAPPLLCAALPTMLLAAGVHLYPPNGWLSLILHVIAYSLIFAFSSLFFRAYAELHTSLSALGRTLPMLRSIL